MITRAPKKNTEDAARNFEEKNGAKPKSIGVLLKMRPDLFERISAQAIALGMPRTAYIVSTVVADMDRREARPAPAKKKGSK